MGTYASSYYFYVVFYERLDRYSFERNINCSSITR